MLVLYYSFHRLASFHPKNFQCFSCCNKYHHYDGSRRLGHWRSLLQNGSSYQIACQVQIYTHLHSKRRNLLDNHSWCQLLPQLQIQTNLKDQKMFCQIILYESLSNKVMELHDLVYYLALPLGRGKQVSSAPMHSKFLGQDFLLVVAVNSLLSHPGKKLSCVTNHCRPKYQLI